MSTVTDTTRTTIITPADWRDISKVGRVVQYLGTTYTVHSCEGTTFYVHQDRDTREIKIDVFRTSAQWYMDNRYLLVPTGCKIGEGFGLEVDCDSRYLRWGVDLRK